MSEAQISEGAPSAPVTDAPAVTPAASTPEPVKETFDQTLERVANEAINGKRGADGKFQSRVVAPGAPETPSVPGSPTAAAAEPATPAIEPPQSLPAEVKAKWANLSPDWQAYLSKREGEVHQKITSDGERLKTLGAFEEVLKPLEARLRQVNAPPHEYVRRLAAADQLLATNGVEGLRQIAAMYGIDLRAALQQSPATPQSPQLDIQSLVNQGVERALAEQRVAAKATEIDTFRTSLPEDERADFDKLEAAMTGLFLGNQKLSLSDLYKAARRADPDLYAKDMAKAQKEAADKAAEEAKKKAAEDAKIATFARKPGTAPTTAAKGDIWSTMDRVGKEIRARG